MVDSNTEITLHIPANNTGFRAPFCKRKQIVPSISQRPSLSNTVQIRIDKHRCIPSSSHASPQHANKKWNQNGVEISLELHSYHLVLDIHCEDVVGCSHGVNCPMVVHGDNNDESGLCLLVMIFSSLSVTKK